MELKWTEHTPLPTGGDSIPNLLKHLEGFLNHDEHEQLMDEIHAQLDLGDETKTRLKLE